MDAKKIFELEYLLESLRPELTEAEVLATMDSDEHGKAKVNEIASFSVAVGDDGVYVKPASKDGEHGKMLHLNPFAAEQLALEILHGISEHSDQEDSETDEKVSKTTFH